MRNFTLQEYFFYTRLERNACNVLVILIMLLFVLPSFYPYFLTNRAVVDFSEIQSGLSALQVPVVAQYDQKAKSIRDPEPRSGAVELFAFDPNTADKDDFVRLGLSPRTAQTILNYRAKGGKFYKKEDFGKIYGVRAEDYTLLAPWIQIQQADSKWKRWEEDRENKPYEKPSGEAYSERFQNFSPKEKVPVVIDVNLATVEEWQQLRGIGPSYAKRIVNFREKLGGFASLGQVGETYGLPDSTFQQILPSLQLSPVLRKININTATLEELKKHPLLSNFQATILSNYRLQHGAFADMASLKKTGAAFKESDWELLEAYISFD